MSEDEKLKLRRDWEKFKGTDLVIEIMKPGGDVGDAVSRDTTEQVENFKENFKEKSAKDAVDSVIKLIGDSSSIDDIEIKKTRTNIERADTEMGKIFVGNTKLLDNLKNYKTAIKFDSLSGFQI